MEEYRKVFFDKARNGFLIVDDKSRILDANHYFLFSFASKLNGVINKDLSYFFESEINLHKSILTILKSKENIYLSEIYSPINKRYFSFSIFCLDDNKIGIEIDDITEKRRIKTEKINYQKKYEELNKFKEILLSNLNHELRTPLNGIIGYSQLLQIEINDPSLNEMAKMIYQSGKRLLKTLNSILMLTELEADKLKINLADIHLYSVVKSIVLAFEEICQVKGLKLKLETKDKNIFARIDEYLFYKLLANILDNAIKFTEKGHVVIEIDSINNKGQVFGIIKIIDSGIGINNNQIKYIYNAFRQGSEGLSRKYGGVGLGLTLSREMIELMGGKIEIESKINKGTIVTLIFKGSYNFDSLN